ncbi:MAG: ClbS/DfsB family four-helix bundle protein [Acholeplasma sp.]|nr:ClbS/DfsB family four-helix bundle protein [Acholeplasma sp.]
MARATSKIDLINSAQDKYKKLIELMESGSQQDMEKDFQFSIEGKKEAHWARDKNVRDIIIHLYEWHQLLLTWVVNNTKGITSPFLPAPYNWKTYGDMNIELWKKHQSTLLDEALSLFIKSYDEVMILANGFDNDQLFTKGVFKWTGSSTLGAYFVSATASHYEWAYKKIKMHLNTLK